MEQTMDCVLKKKKYGIRTRGQVNLIKQKFGAELKWNLIYNLWPGVIFLEDYSIHSHELNHVIAKNNCLNLGCDVKRGPIKHTGTVVFVSQSRQWCESGAAAHTARVSRCGVALVPGWARWQPGVWCNREVAPRRRLVRRLGRHASQRGVRDHVAAVDRARPLDPSFSQKGLSPFRRLTKQWCFYPLNPIGIGGIVIDLTSAQHRNPLTFRIFRAAFCSNLMWTFLVSIHWTSPIVGVTSSWMCT